MVPVATIVGRGATCRIKVALWTSNCGRGLLCRDRRVWSRRHCGSAEGGQTLTRSMYAAMFQDANRRCAAAGLLRNTFAVVTFGAADDELRQATNRLGSENRDLRTHLDIAIAHIRRPTY